MSSTFPLTKVSAHIRLLSPPRLSRPPWIPSPPPLSSTTPAPALSHSRPVAHVLTLIPFTADLLFLSPSPAGPAVFLGPLALRPGCLLPRPVSPPGPDCLPRPAPQARLPSSAASGDQDLVARQGLRHQERPPPRPGVFLGPPSISARCHRADLLVEIPDHLLEIRDPALTTEIQPR